MAELRNRTRGLPPDLTRRLVGVLSLFVFALGSGCARKADPPLLGTLEWDRASVMAEVSEPIMRIDAAEGDTVRAGTPILELDPRRTDAELARARAQAQQAQAQLAELRHGARAETIDAARADLARAEAEAANSQSEQERIARLRREGVATSSAFDRAQADARSTRDATRAARARLDELLHGTRPEDIDQAAAAFAAAEAEAESLQVRRERLSVRAPRDGRIDALPFKLGDQPPQGAILVTLLTGEAPYARIYVPASRRAQLAIGASCTVRVEGVATPFQAKLRSLRSDPAFTPYYALTGEDASRLAYRAELALQGADATRLPAGLPATADCSAGHEH
ncbi:MAG: HlyD family efflux transporter periplasmic adaptor subunit [Nevskia sp.]|nr:HlyD family efflux transporter periplasmic adaptor subunit [Nevskia sp.]